MGTARSTSPSANEALLRIIYTDLHMFRSCLSCWIHEIPYRLQVRFPLHTFTPSVSVSEEDNGLGILNSNVGLGKESEGGRMNETKENKHYKSTMPLVCGRDAKYSVERSKGRRLISSREQRQRRLREVAQAEDKGEESYRDGVVPVDPWRR